MPKQRPSPKREHSTWYNATFASVLVGSALGTTALVLTALNAARFNDWAGVGIAAFAIAIITITPIPLMIRFRNILYQPDPEQTSDNIARTGPTSATAATTRE